MVNYSIIKSDNYLGESGFYLKKNNTVVWLDLAYPSINFYSINNNKFEKKILKLKKPLGNVYPLTNSKFIISSSNGLYLLNKNKKVLSKIGDIRKKEEKKYLIYNDGTISKNKLWIGLSHIKEKKSLGYFGYVYNNNFYVVDKKFKVSNGPAIDKKNNKIYFSDSFNRIIYQYSLKNFKRKKFYKFRKSQGYPDGIALDTKGGLWVAHWGGGKISRIKKNGNHDFSFSLPAFNITSVTFVGKNLSSLFVTSAKIDTNKKQLNKYNYSGSSFIIKTKFKGISIPYTNTKMLMKLRYLR